MADKQDDYLELTVIVPKDDSPDQKRAEARRQIVPHLAPAQEIDELLLGEERPHPSHDHVQVVAKYKTKPKGGGSYTGGVQVK